MRPQDDGGWKISSEELFARLRESLERRPLPEPPDTLYRVIGGMPEQPHLREEIDSVVPRLESSGASAGFASTVDDFQSQVVFPFGDDDSMILQFGDGSVTGFVPSAWDDCSIALQTLTSSTQLRVDPSGFVDVEMTVSGPVRLVAYHPDGTREATDWFSA